MKMELEQSDAQARKDSRRNAEFDGSDKNELQELRKAGELSYRETAGFAGGMNANQMRGLAISAPIAPAARAPRFACTFAPTSPRSYKSTSSTP